MKERLLSLLSLAFMLTIVLSPAMLVSCSSDDNTSGQEERPQGPEYTILQEKKSSNYTSLIVKYTTVGADMKTAKTVSGVITIPNGSISATILDNHFTITDNAEAPSTQGTTDIGKIIGGEYCIVSSDYIGFGITKDEHQTYLCHDVCAKNALDLVIVAQDILKQRSLDGGKLFNLGYSQGGAVALAVHRMMENDPALANKLNFKASWCGDGPYDVVATTEYYLNNSDNVSYPAALPLLVEGFLASAPAELKGNLKFSDFFTEKMIKAGLEQWVSGRNMDTGVISEKMQAVVGDRPLTVSDIFSENMSTIDSPLMKKYLEFAKQNDLCKGWKPSKYYLKLIHMESDNVVPVINAQNAIRGLDLGEGSYQILPLKMSHGDFGQSYYLAAMGELQHMLQTE